MLELELFLKVPRARFVDSDGSEVREVHYKPGSTVELRCLVRNTKLNKFNLWEIIQFLCL